MVWLATVIVALSLLIGATGFAVPSSRVLRFLRRTSSPSSSSSSSSSSTSSTSALHMARLKKGTEGSSLTPAAPDFVVGEAIPEEIAKQACIYDMVLVERFNQPDKTDFGLFLPTVEGKDQKHLGKVLSVPTSYGLEGENGRLAGIEEIAPYKVGDIVYIRDPWGIGPKDQEFGKRCFSFHKAAQITGMIKQA